MTFDSLGLSQAVLTALSKKGFEEPTTIQGLTIPKLMQPGPALIARARTGTGKTAAFGIPLVEKLSVASDHIRALILVPTRELALQVTGEIASLKSTDRPRLAPVYGGASMGEQLRRIASGIDIVVGTPGRVLDHLNRGSLKLDRIEFFVLDEADEMLDMGFIEDIETIMGMCNPEARTVLFSATMPRPILDIVRRRLGTYETVEDFSEAVATELAEQVWLEIQERDRLEALCRIMDVEEDFYGIVFTATRVEAEKLAKSLEERGYEADALHGDITQDRRERILARFRDKRLRVLVATDVASRGIDIDCLSHVVNWSLPHDPDSYLHRVGRTGRAGNAGTALTFVTPDEYRKLFRFKRAAGSAFRKGSVPAVSEVLSARRERLRGRVFSRAEKLDFLPGEIGAEGSGAENTEEEGALPGRLEADASPAKIPSSTAKVWLTLADEILDKLESREALASVLFEAYGSELDPARYHDISEVSVDSTAIVRLFIGAGRKDRLSPRDLAAMIKKTSGLPDRLVGSIEIYENFSFVSVPFEAAEKVIAGSRKSGGMPLVKLATPRGQFPDGAARGEFAGKDSPRTGYAEGSFRRSAGAGFHRDAKSGYAGDKSHVDKPYADKPQGYKAPADRPFAKKAPRTRVGKDRKDEKRS